MQRKKKTGQYWYNVLVVESTGNKTCLSNRCFYQSKCESKTNLALMFPANNKSQNTHSEIELKCTLRLMLNNLKSA